MIPGELVDLSGWRLVLPEPEDDGSGPVVIEQPELDEFELHPLFYANDDGALWVACPVDGYSETATAATELIQAAGGWTLDDTDDHVLTAALMCDPSAVAGAREAVVGSIGVPGHTPHLELIVTHAGHPGALVVVKDGQQVLPVLTGLRSDTQINWRLSVTGGRGWRFVYLYAGTGESMPMTPVYSWPVDEFEGPSRPCEFRTGVRCVEPTTGSGRVLVRLRMLDMI